MSKRVRKPSPPDRFEELALAIKEVKGRVITLEGEVKGLLERSRAASKLPGPGPNISPEAGT